MVGCGTGMESRLRVVANLSRTLIMLIIQQYFNINSIVKQSKIRNMLTRLLGRAFSAPSARLIEYLQGYANKAYIRSFSSSIIEAGRLDNLVSEAEKIVGYPTSLLRCLLTDEISSVLVHIKKLVGSRHPLVKTARRLVYDGAEGFEAIDLIVLLMSRSCEPLMAKCAPLGHQPISGVQWNQRKLAEIAEMINTGYMVHLSVMNTANFQSSDDFKVMNFGNKISILTGDFFLSKASVGLSELENSEVVDIMAGVIGDIVEGETQKDHRLLKDLTWKDWEDIVYKSRGSLFAKSCLAALKLCSLSQTHQDAAFSFGKYLAFLQQLQTDHQVIMSNVETISITNAVVVLTKDGLPPKLIENNQNSFLIMDENLKVLIQNTNTEMQDLCNTYGNTALESLGHFPSSEAKTCLENLVKHIMQVLQNVR